ncbi:MAG TPA: response regulator transcription factor [Terriglobales bacterium]|nr:response regulator transcription factor [Terriglobales bacterium]
MSITCLVVDDHTLFREGLRRLLEGEPDLEVVGDASDAARALELVQELSPKVVLMDIGMPGLSSFEAARLITAHCPETRVLFLTMYEDEDYLRQGMEAGAGGYLLKDTPAPKLIQAVRKIAEGGQYVSPAVMGESASAGGTAAGGRIRGSFLTPREREVVKLIAEGNSVRQIAQHLGLSVKTVEAHKFNLMRKLNIHNKAQLVTYAIRQRIVKLPAGA